MKIKIFIVLLFSMTFMYSQNLKTKDILNNTYGLDYDKSDNTFTICINANTTKKKCVQEIVANDNTFLFQENLKNVLVKVMDTITFKIFEEELKLDQFNTIDYTKVKMDYAVEELSVVDNETVIIFNQPPTDFPEFKIKKSADSTYALSSDGILSDGVEITVDEIATEKDTFIKVVQLKLDSIKTEISNAYVPKVKSKFFELLQELYNTKITMDADYDFLASEELINRNGVTNTYDFYQLLDKTEFHLRVCLADECKLFTDINNGVKESDFINTLSSRHGMFEKDSALNKAALGKIYLLALNKVNEKIISKDKQAFEEGFKQKIKEIESGNDTYSGQFVLNKSVRLYKKRNDTLKQINNEGNYILDKNNKPKIEKVTTKYEPINNIELKVDSINIHIFNNRADNITVIGRLSNEPERTLVLTNSFYSLPLREFKSKVQRNSLVDSENNIYYYLYDDILDYLPYKKYNYAVRNGNVKVKANDTVKVLERKIGDYFTGIFFSDILGLNSNNGNSLITAEGRIRIPWHFRNSGRSTIFDNITAYASVNLVSGLEDNSRRIIVEDTFNPDESSEENKANFKSNNFNLLINNNIDLGVSVTPYTFEWKGASTFVHTRYGIRFLRTGVEYNLKERIESEVDGETVVQENILEERNFQVYSLGHEAEINFEIRPQSFVGADLTVGLNWFRATGTNKNDLNFRTSNNTPNFKLLANIYSFTDSEDSNSGIYVRLGGHYNLGNSKVFPQLMVGYATNLSSFVNKVAKE